MSVAAISAPAGARGFDCNTVVRPSDATRFVDAGYRFALRYIPREVAKDHDLSAVELRGLLEAGLGVMPVQHVERDGPPWWTPTNDKGQRYGATAAKYCTAIGLPRGVTVWLDLEGVVPGLGAEAIIRYANYWHDRVAGAGYQPGIYVGYGCGLSPTQLYQRLKFTRYWAAFNLNRDEYPAVRGVCMRQRSTTAPAGVAFAIDGNTVTADALGGLPTVAALETALPG